MRRFWQVFLIFAICITGALAEKLESGKAYIVSSINVNSTGNVEAGKSYSLVPQVVIATGSEYYAGSVTMFTGCYDGKRYEKGIYKASCLTSVINNLNSTDTANALSAAQGKVLNDKLSNVYTKEEVDNKISNAGVSASDLLTMIYPVGSIYMSTSNISPESFLGGKWRALDEGRVLIGANNTYAAGSKGGEASHTLTVAEMPSHSHSASTNTTGGHSHSASTNETGGHTHTEQSINVTGSYTYTGGSGSNMYNGYKTNNTGWAGNHSHTVYVSSNGDHSHTVTVNNNGSGNAHNNMQPYLAVYMWERYE